ncbi:MAG: hypothetical protein WBN43_17450 [Thiogranum sp.]
MADRIAKGCRQPMVPFERTGERQPAGAGAVPIRADLYPLRAAKRATCIDIEGGERYHRLAVLPARFGGQAGTRHRQHTLIKSALALHQQRLATATGRFGADRQQGRHAEHEYHQKPCHDFNLPENYCH